MNRHDAELCRSLGRVAVRLRSGQEDAMWRATAYVREMGARLDFHPLINSRLALLQPEWMPSLAVALQRFDARLAATVRAAVPVG